MQQSSSADCGSRSLCNHRSKKFQSFCITGTFTLKRNHTLHLVRSWLSSTFKPIKHFFLVYKPSNLKLHVHINYFNHTQLNVISCSSSIFPVSRFHFCILQVHTTWFRYKPSNLKLHVRINYFNHMQLDVISCSSSIFPVSRFHFCILQVHTMWFRYVLRDFLL